MPAVVKRPHRIRSRRETWPWERAFKISARFLRAFSASFNRAFDAFDGKYILPLSLSSFLGAPSGTGKPDEVAFCQGLGCNLSFFKMEWKRMSRHASLSADFALTRTVSEVLTS